MEPTEVLWHELDQRPPQVPSSLNYSLILQLVDHQIRLCGRGPAIEFACLEIVKSSGPRFTFQQCDCQKLG